MFGSASPTLTESDVFEIATRLVRPSTRKPSAGGLTWLETLSLCGLASLPGQMATVWLRSGERGARVGHLRHGAVDIEGHVERLGVAVEDIELDDAGRRLVAVAT